MRAHCASESGRTVARDDTDRVVALGVGFVDGAGLAVVDAAVDAPVDAGAGVAVVGRGDTEAVGAGPAVPAQPVSSALASRPAMPGPRVRKGRALGMGSSTGVVVDGGPA
jgi:hypothetical protein